MRIFLLPILAVALLLLVAVPSTTSYAGVADSDRTFTVEVVTPPVRITPADGGMLALEIDGFRSRLGPAGAPELPLRKMLVAIPPGAEPRLEVRRVGTTTDRPGIPRPVARPRDVPSSARDLDQRLEEVAEAPSVRRPDTRIYGDPGMFPEKLAWLGEIGALRDQRYVEVYVAPARFDRDAERLAIEPSLELTIHFDGARDALGSPRREPEFEAVYRDAFVNYQQGRSFRLSAAGPEAVRQAVSVVAGASSTMAGTGPTRKLRVRENGLVRLDFDYLSAQAPEFLALPVADWRVTSGGEAVPIQVRQIAGGAFDDTRIDRAGEFIQFYGQALDLEPTSILRDTNGPGGTELFATRDFTDENVYFLTTQTAGASIMTEIDGTPGAQPAAGSFFIDTAHEEVDDQFRPYADSDLWYWSPFVTEGSPMRTDVVPLPGLASGTMPLSFRVNVHGASSCFSFSPDHETAVRVDNASFQTLVLPASDPNNSGNRNLGTFDGNVEFTHAFDWTHSGGDPVATDPLRFTLEAFNIPGACTDPGGQILNDNLLNWIEVDYPRSFTAIDDTLSFGWLDGPAVRFEIDGFTDPDVEVWEVTGFVSGSTVRDAIRLTGVEVEEVPPLSGNYTARFRIDDTSTGAERRFVVTSAAGAAVPDPTDFTPDRPSDLRTDTSQTDLIVVVHPELIPSICSQTAGACETNNDCPGGLADTCELDPTSALSDYLTLRNSQGLSTRVARIPDIEDEFNDGLPGPVSIEAFLAWVMGGGWSGSPPLYVLLLGDGSYDFKGGTDSFNFVPTELMTKAEAVLGYYASDNLLAAVVGGDSLADLVVGRVPARTQSDADSMLGKIEQYETMSMVGPWQSKAVFVSDRSKNYADPNEGPMFEGMNTEAIEKLQSTPWTVENLRYWSDFCPQPNPPPGSCDKVAIRDALKLAVNGDPGHGLEGASILQFTGHGNFFVWSDDVIICSDPGICVVDDFMDFDNSDFLPFVLVHNCLTGGFHTLIEKSMGERWLSLPGGGGIAVFAPSGLGFRFIGQDVIEEVFEALFGLGKERLVAVPVMRSLARLCGQDSIEACQYYTLLGDPTTTLQLPTVDAPDGVLATSSNGQVQLDWTASQTPGADYRIYRARFFNGNVVAEGNCPDTAPYCPVGFTSTTSFVDSSVQNALSYVYTLTAVDAGGFESRISNFNTDCVPTPGADCVLGQPINAVAPLEPTGLVATDPEVGGTLITTWNPNAEDDVDFYTIHHGPTPAVEQTRIVGTPGPMDNLTPPTMATFSGLVNGEPYYFALTATNTSGITSSMTPIVSGEPSLVLGVKSPAPVDDLVLAKNGVDAALSWGPVTLDIYGDDVTVGQYEVFRGETVQFLPALGNRVGTPTAAAFDDSGALSVAQPDYFYLVRGIDGFGNPGGLGGQLPDGVRDLVLSKTGVIDHVLLDWSAVTVDFDGDPTQIAHYELYVAGQVFGRLEIEQGAVSQLGGSILETQVELGPEPAVRFYSILAVDTRGNKSPF